jgi:hypothetical protein
MRGSENGDPQLVDSADLGTAESARRRVRAYFQSLRDQLCVQEVAALTVVDTHVRERLCSIRQQEEDIATLLSQVNRSYLLVHTCSLVLHGPPGPLREPPVNVIPYTLTLAVFAP